LFKLGALFKAVNNSLPLNTYVSEELAAILST
jgi:hypothetical protein